MVMDKFNNCKNELLIRFMLGTMIFLSEIAIIFITNSPTFNNFIVIFFTLFTLNLAFIIFGVRQKQTRQKMLEAHKNAEDSRNRILTIINSLTDGVLSIDSHGKIELYNSAALEILGENDEILNKIKLKLLVLVETELWPNLINEVNEKNSRIIVVNGRISDRSYPRYKKLKFLLKSIDILNSVREEGKDKAE